MKESDIEGVASHDGPESCGCIRKEVREALTGGKAGRAMEPRNHLVQSADAVIESGRPHPSQRKGELERSSARSENLSMRGNSMRENRESPSSSCESKQDRRDKAGGRTARMNESGQSDSPVVPTKSANKTAQAAAEPMEGRGGAKGNTDQRSTSRTQSRTSVSQELERVRQAARRDRKAKFTALLHHVTVERLREAFQELKRMAAPGVDGVTWSQYEQNLERNLQELHTKVQQGSYQASPSLRVYIPKADGTPRALGMAALQDKIVQRAVAQVLSAIYEEDFLGFSYGFRPGRSQHDALDAFAVGLYAKKVNWVLDVDIRGFYDTVNHEWMQKFVENRIADRRVCRLIQKWMKAGVMEDGSQRQSDRGIQQGASISPLMGNLYLHYVLDLWAHAWRKRKAHGDVLIVRYADDVLIGFEHRIEAEQFQKELSERLRKFALEMHPEKTRLVEFGRYTAERRKKRGEGKPATIDFLGFTHICGETKEGKFALRRWTMRKRMRVRLKTIKIELQRRRHEPIDEQGRWLGRVMRGYFAYHAVPTNGKALEAFRTEATRHWRRALQKRSQTSRIGWKRMQALAHRWLPKAIILHPWPRERFGVRTRGKSPVR